MKCFSMRMMAVCLISSASAAVAGDWPQYRHDASRTATTEAALPSELHVQWTRELLTPRPAFPGEERLRFDASYEPVVWGKTMFVPSMVTDSVTALATDTGEVRWQFFADGPIRFAPVAAAGKVFVASDDGFVYCLNATDGQLLWKFRAAPAQKKERKLLGNQRLISLWPVRGAPVLRDGVLYFASGLWPADGVYVYAVDAETGQPRWANTTSDSIAKANMDHGVAQHAGITPQGYLALVGDQLVVPCGAQLPAFLDPQDGKLGEYNMGWGGRVGLPKGSWFVAGSGKHLAHSGDLYDITRPNDENTRGRDPNFKRQLYPGGFTRFAIDPRNQRELGVFRQPVITADAMYLNDDFNGTTFNSIVAYNLAEYELVERGKTKAEVARALDQYPDKWKADLKRQWSLPSKLTVHIKAGSRLYAGATGVVEAIELPKDGQQPRVAWSAKIVGTPHRMLAADDKLFVVTLEGKIYAFGAQPSPTPVVHATPVPTTPSEEVTLDVLTASGASEGYAVLLGVDDVRLIEALVRQSKLSVIAIDPDAAKVAKLREQLTATGSYGTRATVHVGDPATYPLPPYLANLVVARHSKQIEPAVRHALRPFGGVACFTVAKDQQNAATILPRLASGNEFAAKRSGDFVLMRRDGPLPGADDWSHAGANAANAGASQDRFLKAPLGLLWFDGSLRWHRKPGSAVVRVATGRVIVLANELYAIDAFTGRPLWRRKPPIPFGANADIVAVDNRIYFASNLQCIELDAATGRTLRELPYPADVSGSWSNLRIDGAHLVGSIGKHVVCLDRETGKTLWKYECGRAALHLAVGGGRVFCAERIDARRGETVAKVGAQIHAIDINTGQAVWAVPGAGEVHYSTSHELLVTTQGILKAGDGSRLRDSVAEPQLVGDRLLSGSGERLAVFEMATGKTDGGVLEWFRRGCTGMRSSTHLVTTRYKANAAYMDLDTREFTPLWNIRPGCNNNLYPAGGLLNVPNVTGGCECNYTPTSKAFAPVAELVR